MKKRFCIAVALLLLLTGCNTLKSTAPAPQKQVTLKWMLPGKGDFPHMQTVFAEINRQIQEEYPAIRLEFDVINKYQYHEKLSLCISTGEQVDLAWCNDHDTPYLFEISANSFRILNDYIDKYGKDIRAAISDRLWASLQRNERVYFLPTVYAGQGMIPFLQIPRELSNYLDVDLFAANIIRDETLLANHLDTLERYLERVVAAGQLTDGVDFDTLSSILPLKGYEELHSFSGLIGYRMQDASCRLVDLTSIPERELVQTYLNRWTDRGFITKNRQFPHYKRLDEANNFVLSAVWGYYDQNGLHTILADDVTDKYLYIPVDTYTHSSRMIADSAVYIPKNSQYPAETIQALNLFHQNSELYTLLSYGQKEIDYKIADRSFSPQFPVPRTYDIYPGLLPHLPNIDFGIDMKCVVWSPPQEAAVQLNEFEPSITAVSAELNLLAALHRDSPSSSLAQTQEMQTVLAHFQEQVDRQFNRR